ncbi:GFA family protein [Vibrio sp. VPAP30]|uniref:GFA family protein n=1 Tax=Vibrio sp. VPAP30 TaxID=1647102 RepID=UPI000658C6AA|nr:GFA family protein [Vibrio sp. VPAP30]KLN67189.1 aldehyde-activating protein [Vibrio sp. VPAP30]
MSREIKGSCCCGKVTFQLKDEFKMFFFCHCLQCRKLTGSAHASNLFTSPDNIKWLSGEESVKRYDHPTRSFSKTFCTHCGSALPFLTQSSKFLIVPAGSLDQEPEKKLDAQIFCNEQADWHREGLQAIKVDGFPS